MLITLPHAAGILSWMEAFRRLLRSDLPRYFIASLLALAVDTAVLSASLRMLHLPLVWSATLGFSVGAAVAYLLSIRWVFRQRTLARAPAFEFLTFASIGVVGLGVTQLVLWIGVTKLHLLPEAVKLGAAIMTFAFNYLVRRALLFAAARHAPQATESPV